MTFNPEPFQLVPALLTWLLVFVACLGVAVAVAALTGLLTGGVGGLKAAFGGLAEGAADFARFSPGRAWAIAMLTFREAVRRKALLVFVVFALLFMFAGWFLSNANERPDLQVKVHVAFVLTAISFLVLPIALLLSCWGIPEDIRRRSMHTVVTKPVRRSEIVLGRILGYVGILTVVLTVMGSVGYLWIVRQVPESARGALVSRQPIFGSLDFRGPDGGPMDRGINVGDIWTFRSYVAGATKARGIYEFDGVTPAALTPVRREDRATGQVREDAVLKLESNFEAFRTFKGDMTRGIYVQYTYVNPALEVAQSMARDLAIRLDAAEGGAVDENQIRGLLNALRGLTAVLLEDVRRDEAELRKVPQFLDRFSAEIPIVAETLAAKIAEREKARRSEKDPQKVGRIDADLATYRRRLQVAEGLPARVEEIKTRVAVGLPKLEATESRLTEAQTAVADVETGDPKLGESIDVARTALDGIEAVEYQDPDIFPIQEFETNIQNVPVRLPPTDDRFLRVATTVDRSEGVLELDPYVDLFEFVAPGGRLRVEVAALDAGQYLGLAPPDLFVRRPDRNFAVGFTKAVVGIWLMVVLLVTLGVTASTFTKGPVATLLTFTLLLVGLWFRPFMENLTAQYAEQTLDGGGPIESIVRIVRHMNPSVELDPGPLTTVIQGVDQVFLVGLYVIRFVIPDFGVYNMSEYVSNGFDVSWSAGLLPAIGMTLAFLPPCLLLGYYALRFRELEAK